MWKLIVLAVLLAGLAAAQNSLTPDEVAAGWESLFDGRDASQWNGGIGEPFPSRIWTVEDGCLRTTGAGPGASLYSVRPFSTFDVKWEWRISARGNSGLKYNCLPGRIDPDTTNDLRSAGLRTLMLSVGFVVLGTLLLYWPAAMRQPWVTRCGMAAAALVIVYTFYSAAMIFRGRAHALHHPPGFEYQMIDDDDYHHSLNTIHGTASLYDLLAASDAAPNPPGQWNESRVVIDGAHVEHWLNGRKVLAYDLGSPQLSEAVGRGKFLRIDGFADTREGHLQLQHHGTPVWFRNIRIRELKQP